MTRHTSANPVAIAAFLIWSYVGPVLAHQLWAVRCSLWTMAPARAQIQTKGRWASAQRGVGQRAMLRRIPGIALSALVAAIVPLQQAHGIWMPIQAQETASAPAQACCIPCQGCSEAQQQESSSVCECNDLAVRTMSAASRLLPPSYLAMSKVASGWLLGPTHASLPAPDLDIGSSPLPADPSLHGLRAPPLFT